jgi:hypothetical protein
VDNVVALINLALLTGHVDAEVTTQKQLLCGKP